MGTKSKIYPLSEAIKLVREAAHENFDATLELHLTLNTSNLRKTTTLPHPIKKEVNILVFAEGAAATAAKKAGADKIGNKKTLDELGSSQIPWDVIVTTSKLMPQLATLGKVLGPKGLMPNPKNGTLTDDPAKIVTELKGGKITIKSENRIPLAHIVLGKLSFKDSDLEENFKAVIKLVSPNNIKSATLTSTMGPGIKVDF